MKRIIHTGVYGGVAEKVFTRLFGEETPLCHINRHEQRYDVGMEWFTRARSVPLTLRSTMRHTNVTTAPDGEVVLSTYGGESWDPDEYIVDVAWRRLDDGECMKYVASILKTPPSAVNRLFKDIPAEDVELVRAALAGGAGSLPKSEIERIVGRQRDPVETELRAAYDEEAMKLYSSSYQKICRSKPAATRKLEAAYNARAAKIASKFGVKWPVAKYFIGLEADRALANRETWANS